MISLSKLYKALDARFPFARAESWDKVGLLVGDKNVSVNRALVCYEVTDAALDLAEENGCDAVVAYHPLIFRPLEKLDFSDRTARLCARLIRARQNLICVHTALDGAAPPHALGDALARQLGLEGALVHKASGTQKLAQLVYFVPESHLDKTREAAWKAGAGAIGLYDEASFALSGQGTFRPREGANPAEGKVGVRAETSEWRVEVLIPSENAGRVLSDIKAAHPYEEVAYFLTALQNEDSNQKYGPLRLASVPNAELGEWVERAKTRLNVPSVRVAAPDVNISFSSVACSPGSGASFISSLPHGTIFISGDFKHHDALAAQARGVALIDVTHAATETTTVELMAEAIDDCIEVVRETPRNPFDFA
ncbi:GTP cyclohydrolase 1 type 2 [Abditibacteriota bacterium]|nr:GTP cyclohydrolase 1 type 2 [Abditibacteriota bacterium]